MLPAKDPDRFPIASEALLWLAALGPAEILAAGRAVRLPPKTLAVLLRLALAPGEPVAVDQIFRDIWRPGAAKIGRHERTSVQKRITELRQAVDDGTTGSVPLIVMERVGRNSFYRLMLAPQSTDVDLFSLLIERAATADAVDAADLLGRALALWRGQPLQDIEHLPFARAHINRLTTLRYEATADLIGIYRQLGQPAQAFALAKQLATLHPEDSAVRDLLTDIQADLRRSRRGLVRRSFGGEPPVAITIVSGDVFEEEDAHLVIGFCDTFDTDTAANLVINSASLQAQAMRLLFDDDRTLLDRQLRAALGKTEHIAREERRNKKHGKLLRYPIGTVAVLRRAGRCVFALGYSRMGNDLVAKSTRADLEISLDRLWEAVYLHGQLRPIAIPLIGTGLARVDGVGRTDVLRLIAESFFARTRVGRISTELRIVLRPDDVADLEVRDLAQYLEKL